MMRTHQHYLLRHVAALRQQTTVEDLRSAIERWERTLKSARATRITSRQKKYVLGELEQIRTAHTLERAHYYLRRLERSFTSEKSGLVNDINLHRWKEYTDILTDSLWHFKRRDSDHAHRAWYWGNFVPQIPRQLLLRYTKRADWVLDPFAGSGTTLLECQRLGRNGIGIELQPSVAEKTQKLLQQSAGTASQLSTEVVVGDSTRVDLRHLLQKRQIDRVQLAILHPPYHDIIKFSSRSDDLSNARSTEEFLHQFGSVVKNVVSVLENGRYLAVVIGDKYSKREWIPLGFLTMQETLKHGCALKSIVVKNFEETTGKRNQKELWRYRALAGGFYVFKHEYIFIFQKNSPRRRGGVPGQNK